ncbi:hypothetical protein NDU88_004561 [Pleurodeles waltl]|uniref:Uncharacterized protein n=1 Tax=Pleurodeles waltl TaxID=8319 RepID=A0AAV7PG32_PLEWA|nr:hypothetical protein NDU88_004561 [Pleurodeles waltl]
MDTSVASQRSVTGRNHYIRAGEGVNTGHWKQRGGARRSADTCRTKASLCSDARLALVLGAREQGLSTAPEGRGALGVARSLAAFELEQSTAGYLLGSVDDNDRVREVCGFNDMAECMCFLAGMQMAHRACTPRQCVIQAQNDRSKYGHAASGWER